MGLQLSKCFNCFKKTDKFIDDLGVDDHLYQSELRNLKSNTSIQFFNLENQVYFAKCVKCYDGDTVHLVFRYPNNMHGKLWKWRCRINGIDTPEMRTSSSEEKEMAIKARDCLANLVLNQLVMANVKGFDKYGRLLVDLTIKKNDQIINVGEHLIEAGLANRYDGGTKTEWNFD